MTGEGALVRGVMARHIFVVARAHPDLFEFLLKQFADDANVSVVLDRRTAHRRLHSGEIPVDGERRRADRRSRPAIDEELRSRSHAIITLPD